MRTPKATLVVNGIRLVDRAIGALRAGGCDPVFAVVRAGVEIADATPVLNPEPDRGLASSLALAVDAAAHAGAEALLITLVDMPGVDGVTVRAVREAYTPGRVAMAAYPDRQGHPVAMSLALWREALELADADEGARALLAARPLVIDVVRVSSNPADLDTPEQLREWQE